MKHHILVKWTEAVTDKAAIAREAEALFRQVLEVEGVTHVAVHPNVINRPNRYDLMIVITMAKSALPAYDACDAHHRWKQDYADRIAQKAIFDCD